VRSGAPPPKPFESIQRHFGRKLLEHGENLDI
jgi:hypothetical protein